MLHRCSELGKKEENLNLARLPTVLEEIQCYLTILEASPVKLFQVRIYLLFQKDSIMISLSLAISTLGDFPLMIMKFDLAIHLSLGLINLYLKMDLKLL